MIKFLNGLLTSFPRCIPLAEAGFTEGFIDELDHSDLAGFLATEMAPEDGIALQEIIADATARGVNVTVTIDIGGTKENTSTDDFYCVNILVADKAVMLLKTQTCGEQLGAMVSGMLGRRSSDYWLVYVPFWHLPSGLLSLVCRGFNSHWLKFAWRSNG
jgi:hypothetical protein